MIEIIHKIGYNDDEKSVAFLERVVKELHPDNLAVIPIDEPFQKVLGVGEDRLEAIRKRLEKARGNTTLAPNRPFFEGGRIHLP